MTLDDLAVRFRARSDEPLVQRLGELLLHWKENGSTVLELDKEVEHYFGTTWIEDENTFNDVFHAWKKFKEEAIDQIGGMTMNERLYHFSLFDRFDSDESEQALMYRKLLAQP